MYRIINKNDLSKLKVFFELKNLSFYEKLILENIEKNYFFGRIINNSLIDLIYANERENGLNIFFKTTDNFDLEKSLDFLRHLDKKFFILDVNTKIKDFFVNKEFRIKAELIRYEIIPYESYCNIELVKIEKKDLLKISELDEVIFGKFWKQGKTSIFNTFENPKNIFLKYIENEKIVAYTIFNDTHIIRLGVHPDFQKKGIGKKIVLSTISYLKNKNAEKITLITQTTNDKAKGLYESVGFQKINSTYVLEN